MARRSLIRESTLGIAILLDCEIMELCPRWNRIDEYK